MTALTDEIDANFATFGAAWIKALNENKITLSSSAVFLESYRRISSIQALKSSLLPASIESEALDFFIEAQNDILLSHVQASVGSWRIALQSLRAAIENALSCLYYADHPVELELWKMGEFRLGFSAALKYFELHPHLRGVPNNIIIELLKTEYATLSKAVHGSAVDFWMTKSSSNISLWNTDSAKAGMWSTRERKVLQGIALLVICLYQKLLTGTQRPGVRETLSLLLTKVQKKFLKDKMSISIA